MCDILISIIIPCFNEVENIEELSQRLYVVLNNLKYEYELIFIDDGSTDNTIEKLISLSEKNKRIRIIELSRNFGHQAAICAGIDHAYGKAIIMMDADLQHPPEIIPELVKKWEEGFEVVYTIRNGQENISFLKKCTAKIFYRIINRLSNVSIPENSADFRLIDENVAKYFKKLGEREKFIRGLVSWLGFKQYAIRYNASQRFAGKAKYNIWKMIKFAYIGITSFSAVPLRIATVMGFLFSLLAFIYAGYVIYVWLFLKITVPGWTSVILAVLFIGGIQLLCVGILGEYIGRIFDESKKRPSYVIRRIYGRE